jgi:hypothetical protein
MFQQSAAAGLMQYLGQTRFHTGSLPGGENNNGGIL